MGLKALVNDIKGVFFKFLKIFFKLPEVRSQSVFKSNHSVNQHRQSTDLFAAAAAAVTLFSFGFGSACCCSAFCSKKLILCLMSFALSENKE